MRLRNIAITVVVIFSIHGSASAADTKEKKPLPKFDDVKAAVVDHLKGLKDYRPEDILTVGDVAPLFPKLDGMGWKVADQKKILELLLPDADPMVKQLRTPKGRPFMRNVAKMRLGYDRLDRIRQMPYGQFRVREFIDNPKGADMIEYMTSTPNGKNLGKQLTNATNGQDFNKPTGKIYAESALLDRLKASYDAEAAKREPKSAKPAKRAK
jgi:hypothetical protein